MTIYLIGSTPYAQPPITEMLKRLNETIEHEKKFFNPSFSPEIKTKIKKTASGIVHTYYYNNPHYCREKARFFPKIIKQSFIEKELL
jgi:hypothetical protein